MSIGHRQPWTPRVGKRDRDERQRAGRDRPEIARRGVPEERAAELNPKSRLPSDAALELLTAGADQVMADVRFSGIRSPFGDLPGALDALQAPHAPGPRRSVRPVIRRRGGSGRGWQNPSARTPRPDRAEGLVRPD